MEKDLKDFKTMKLSEQELQMFRDVSIHQILGIQNTGRELKIKCPFHNENTPSCTVYPDNRIHCFGCGIHCNNAIDFAIALGLSFDKALEELCIYV